MRLQMQLLNLLGIEDKDNDIKKVVVTINIEDVIVEVTRRLDNINPDGALKHSMKTYKLVEDKPETGYGEG